MLFAHHATLIWFLTMLLIPCKIETRKNGCAERVGQVNAGTASMDHFITLAL
jgi:hypothetical protein